MAEAPLAVEDFSDDLVDEVADEVVGGTTRDQMLGTFSGVSPRDASDPSLHEHQEVSGR